MLLDKDRIFTNLYGYQDWGLKAAQARGVEPPVVQAVEVGEDAVLVGEGHALTLPVRL